MYEVVHEGTDLQAFGLCHFEVNEAFGALLGGDVERRPDSRLNSRGEFAEHIASCEAIRFAGHSPNGSFEPDLSYSKVSGLYSIFILDTTRAHLKRRHRQST